jgi:hypothetical protein
MSLHLGLREGLSSTTCNAVLVVLLGVVLRVAVEGLEEVLQCLYIFKMLLKLSVVQTVKPSVWLAQVNY